jgi:hypothetical protein
LTRLQPIAPQFSAPSAPGEAKAASHLKRVAVPLRSARSAPGATNQQASRIECVDFLTRFHPVMRHIIPFRPPRGAAETSRPHVCGAKKAAPKINRAAPAAVRKAVLYATCFVNYNNPNIGEATRGARPQRGRDRSGLAALLRDAAIGAGRSRRGGGFVVAGFDHPNYARMAAMAEPVRTALAQDLD